MQSDNGTNFISTVKEMNNAIKNLKHDKITTYFNKHQIEWQFNTPLSPWMRGCWEVICEVEYIVNNHPLLPISDDINDYDVLTPNNFLLGYKSRDFNIRNGMQTEQIDYRQKWKQVQNTANMYWNRWLKEYMPNPH